MMCTLEAQTFLNMKIKQYATLCPSLAKSGQGNFFLRRVFEESFRYRRRVFTLSGELSPSHESSYILKRVFPFSGEFLYSQKSFYNLRRVFAFSEEFLHFQEIFYNFRRVSMFSGESSPSLNRRKLS